VAGFDQIISRTDAAGIIPEDFLNEVFSHVPQQSAVLSNMRRLRDGTTNQMRLPILSSLPMAYWVDGEAPDGGLKETTRARWTNKFIDYREIAVIAPIPINVLDDAAFPIWEQVRPYIIEAIGHRIDNGVLFQNPHPAVWPEPVVPSAIAAGNSVAIGTGADIFEDVLGEDGVFAAVEGDGYLVSGSVAHPRFKSRLRGLRAVGQFGPPIFMRAQPSGQDIQSATRYELDGTPLFFLMNGAFDTSLAELISGAWDQAVYSWRRDATFSIHRDGIIQDEYGTTVYNLLQQNMVALRVSARFGWQLPNPTNRLNPTEGGAFATGDVVGRYPFAVLTPGS